MVSIIEVTIGLVTGVIGFVIVDGIVATTAWNSTLAGTIVTYIVPVGMIGLLGFAAYGR
jgi:membrane-anchored protein YejM (alkaline phosphatase superfamily)